MTGYEDHDIFELNCEIHDNLFFKVRIFQNVL